MRTLGVVTLAITLVGSASTARAGDDDDLHLPSNEAIATMLALEWVIPDVRIQLREDERLVLSWPMHLVSYEPRRNTMFTAFVEPQYQTSTSDLRAAGGLRVALGTDDTAGILEGGGVLGHDAGPGGFVGLGLSINLGDGRAIPGIGVVGRATFLPDGERRYDLSLDVTVVTLADFIRLATSD